MNIEIKISGETTDQTLVAILASIAVITGGKAEAAAPVIQAAETFVGGATVKGPAKKEPLATRIEKALPEVRAVAEQVTEALDAAPETEFATTPHDTSKPAEAAPSVKREPGTAKKVSKYTLEVVRAEAIAVSKISNDKREEVKALIATHGGVKVTDLDASVYDAFMADLAKLK